MVVLYYLKTADLDSVVPDHPVTTDANKLLLPGVLHSFLEEVPNTIIIIGQRNVLQFVLSALQTLDCFSHWSVPFPFCELQRKRSHTV